MAKVSVIVPVYNSEEYLRKCLDSILNQTLKDIEIIVVNDGSSDSSQEIINDYVQRYPDIYKTIYQENAGQAAARNRGVKYATGEFIMFIDSDDYIEPETLEKAYNAACDGGYDIVCFNFYEEKDGIKIRSSFTKFNVEEINIKYVLNETAAWNKIIRRKILIENNIRFTENRIYEDLELIPQFVLYTDKIKYIDDCLYTYVIHENSTMRQKEYNPKLESIYFVVETLRETLGKCGYNAEVEYLFIEHLLHGATLRYLGYKEGKQDIVKISKIMKRDFPHWRRNRYYKQMDWKYKIVCNLAYFRLDLILKKILGV